MLVAISQRVGLIEKYRERRDQLDQNWTSFLQRCSIVAIPVPNNPVAAADLINELPVEGVLLTGGNDPVSLGGDAPERDSTENELINFAIKGGKPLFGVCRGMQMIQSHFKIPLRSVENHVCSEQAILINGEIASTNSYHRFGTDVTTSELKVWATASDGVIKAIRHVDYPIMGIMWHPERISPFAERDISLVRNFFLSRGSRA